MTHHIIKSLAALALGAMLLTGCGASKSLEKQLAKMPQKAMLLSEVTERGARYLRFDVIDDGDGILPENLPYIWDRYFKENRAHKRADVGTGLGLCIVKRIMEAHGGGYGVNSEPGKGSDFFVTLPLDQIQ